MLADHLITLIAALIVNGLLAGPRRWHRRLGLNKPGQWVVACVRMLERKLNRNRRSPQDLQRRGMVLLAALLLISAGVAHVLVLLLKTNYWGGMAEIVLVASMLCLRQDADFAMDMVQKMDAGEGEAAREELEGTIWRNAALLDGHGICRAAVETLSVHSADRFVSPLFWYLVLGLPGMAACRLLDALADATGYGRDAFGRPAFQAAMMAHYVPSLVSGLLVMLSSVFLPFCSPMRALKAWAQHMTDMDYRRRQVAVFGAALNLSLGGPLSVYAGREWIGGAVAKAYPRDTRRSVLLLWFCGFLLLLALLLALFTA